MRCCYCVTATASESGERNAAPMSVHLPMAPTRVPHMMAEKPNLSHARSCAPRMRYMRYTRRSTPRPRTGKERDAVDGLVGFYQPKCVMQRATSACAAAMPGANSRSLTCHHRLPTAIARFRQIVSDSDASMSRLPSKESQPHRIFVVLRCCLMIFEIIPGFLSFVSNILQKSSRFVCKTQWGQSNTTTLTMPFASASVSVCSCQRD